MDNGRGQDAEVPCSAASVFTEGGEYEIPEEYDYIYFFIYNYV